MKVIKAEALDKAQGTVYRVTVEVSKASFKWYQGPNSIAELRALAGQLVDDALVTLDGGRS